MTIGLLALDIRLPGCYTLKEKRHRLKGVIEKVRSRFNVSATEVGHQDSHRYSEVAVVMVSDETAVIDKVFAKVEEFFENGNGLVITESSIEWF